MKSTVSLIVFAVFVFGSFGMSQTSEPVEPQVDSEYVDVTFHVRLMKTDENPLGYPTEVIEEISEQPALKKLDIKKTFGDSYEITMLFRFPNIKQFHQWYRQKSVQALLKELSDSERGIQMILNYSSR